MPANQEPADCQPFWQANMACCPEWEVEGVSESRQALQERALSLAWGTIRALTGGMVGGCPVLVRPCLNSDPCNECMGGTWYPYVDANGNWKNCQKRKDMSCSCCTLSEIVLPGRAAALEYVTIDGYYLDWRTFRIDDQRKLVRQD